MSERVTGQMDAVELMRAIDAALDDVIGKRAPDMMRPFREEKERKAREQAELLARIEALEVAVAELRGNQQTAGPSTEVAGGCQEQDQAEDRD